MTPAWELVLHHDYAAGSTDDRSGHGNHGYRTARTEAPEPADRTTFDGRSTRVVVFPSATLTGLRGIRVRARVWLNQLGDRRTIVEGYLAFAFMVDPDGALAAAVYTDSRWDELRTPPGSVPLRQWVDVAFGYDGHDTATLFIGGEPAAARYLPMGGVGSVEWPYGLNIGAWPDRDLRVFDGRIAEVWLWRPTR